MNATRPRTEVPPNTPSIPTTRLIGHEGPIHAVTFSHDGKYCLTAGHDRTVRLWNPTRIDPVHAMLSNNNNNNNNNNKQQQQSASSSNVSTTRSSNGGTTTIPLDQIPPALPIQSYTDGHTHPVSSIAIDQSSTTLLSSSEATLIVTDIITQKLKRRLMGHTGRINSVDTCAGVGGGSSEAFVSGSYDGTVRIWDGRSLGGKPLMVLEEGTDSISCVGVRQSNGGGGDVVEICTGSVDGTLRTYDLRKGELRSDNLGDDVAISSIVPTSDGLTNIISCLDGRIHILERSTGESIKTFWGGHTAGRYSIQCDVTADDEYVVCGSEDGSAVVYDFCSGKVVQVLRGHVRPTCSVACHPVVGSSSVVISGSYDGHCVVWTNGDSHLIELE